MRRLERILSATAFGALLTILLPAAALAEEAAKVDSGDTAWMLTSSALVLMMTIPGLAFFYGGLVRGQERAVDADAQLHPHGPRVSVTWVLCGYAMAFGPDVKGLFGVELLAGASTGIAIGPTSLAPTIPTLRVHGLPAHVRDHHAGAHHRRHRRAHEVHGLPSSSCCSGPPSSTRRCATGSGAAAGSPSKWGALDFAGGTVVHISSGVQRAGGLHAAGQAARLRPRADAAAQPALHGHGRRPAVGGLVRLQRRQRAGGERPGGDRLRHDQHGDGAPRCWAGWLTEWIGRGKPTVLGVASGAVAGLVAITPAAGFVSPLAAIADRRGRRACSATARATSRPSSATTTPSTWWACTAWAAPGARWPRGSSPGPP